MIICWVPICKEICQGWELCWECDLSKSESVGSGGLADLQKDLAGLGTVGIRVGWGGQGEAGRSVRESEG